MSDAFLDYLCDRQINNLFGYAMFFALTIIIIKK